MNYFDAFQNQFKNETDRASVILVASILEELLMNILSAKLVGVTSSNDEFFEGTNAPLGTFNSRIEMAFRIGLISSKFTRDLHLIRKIRNDFAHNINGCTFDDTRVISRINALSNSNGIFKRSETILKKRNYEKTPRNEFLESTSWMIWHLEKKIPIVEEISPCGEEWGYSFTHKESEP